MRKSVIIYYVLMLLLVMGAFASMALNDYGVFIMSYASLGFSLVFLSELIFLLPRQTMSSLEKRSIGLELVILVVLCFCYFLKGLLIDIPFGTATVFTLIIALFAINAFRLYENWISLNSVPLKLKVGVISYFIALLLLLAAGFLFGLAVATGLFATVAAFILIAVFIILSRRNHSVIVEGERTSPLRVVSGFKNKSGIILIGFALMMAYYAIGSLNLLPPLYFGSMPNGYSKVVRQAEGSDAESKFTDPKEFEAAYKKFIEGK